MSFDLLPERVRRCYEIHEYRHAYAVLATDFAAELADIGAALDAFQLAKSEIVVGGGGKSKITARFDGFLRTRGWEEREFALKVEIAGRVTSKDSHRVDFHKNRVAVEVEWNNKDPFFSRDLASFRVLHEYDVISVGVIITRADELQGLFDSLGSSVGGKYGASTTHMSKLLPRIGQALHGTCPLLVFGIKKECYIDDIAKPL
jgi:hypothetical protein